MATDGLFVLVCAGALMAGDPAPTPTADRERAVADTLAVQTALQQGREYLLRNDYRNAVHTLEGQLARINGSRVYLGVLQEAYRGHVKELRLAKQDAEAQKYLDRLRILDPGVVLDKALSTPSSGDPPPVPAKKAVIVRPQSAEEEPHPAPNTPKGTKPNDAARELLARADAEFGNRHYREAKQFYEQAYSADQGATESSRERWAYCKLYAVVEQMNQPAAPAWDEWEHEVRRALELAPRLEYGKSLLNEIKKRREGMPVEPAVAVKHAGNNGQGWAVSETASFRVLHNQAPEFAERVARVAEKTRSEMGQKWFGGFGEDWNPKCEILLYATAQDYSRASGVPPTSPGHSEVSTEAGRVVRRRVFLHCDDPNLLPAVLPHETTHVVLAGQYGDRPVPRWCDEGVAVLSEPAEKVERHLRQLARSRQDGQLFSLRQLMQLDEYPDPRYISAFYAQSVSLVDFLAAERGPRVFTEFMRDGLRGGYEAALEKHYGMHGFADLERRWAQGTATSAATATK